MRKELWSLQLVSGLFLLGVGNPFFNREYREELYNDVGRDRVTYEWVRKYFNDFGINTVEQCLLIEIKGTTRLLIGNTGLWRLFLPDGKVQIGMGDCAPDSPQMKAVSKKMQNYFYTRFMYYISSLFDLLRSIEFETPE